MEPAHVAALAALHAQAFDRPWSEREIAELMRSPGVSAWEAEDGFILLRLAGGEAEILTLAVAPEGRRRGAGRALLRGALKAAEQGGATAMFLEVADDNAAAVALYRSEGFVEAGRRRGYYARPGGAAADALVLRRALPSPSR